MNSFFRLIPALGFLLTACATTPPPEATTSYTSAKACSPWFDQTVAHNIAITEPVEGYFRTFTLPSADTPCLSIEGKERPYVLVRLPDIENLASLNLGSILESRRVFSPEVLLLKEDLTISRTLKDKALRHRGKTLSALVRPQPGEKYIAITGNPELIGQKFAFVVTPEAEVPSDPHQAWQHVPYSYEGTVFVRLYFSDPAQLAP